jgi:hypothetical protein
MAKIPKPGDKCPRCKSGLVVKDELGLACDECPWQMELEEVVRRDEESRRGKPGEFKAKKFSLIIDDPEEAENFLRGLIVARSNNSSEYFVDLIDAVNGILQPWRAKQLAEEMHDRAAAGMG